MPASLRFPRRAMLLALSVMSTAWALSPPNPTVNIPWDEDPNTPGSQSTLQGIGAIQSAFDNARRFEEQQWDLAANSLGNLTLPSQADWDATTESEKALFLVNAERVARAGIDYGDGPLLGLPLEAVESHLNQLAEAYAQYMIENDFWSHDVPPSVTAPPFAGTNSFSRIAAHPVIGDSGGSNGGDCSPFLPYAENLSISASSSTAPIKMITERAVYGFIYNDGGSAWGHRKAMLIQDTTLTGGSGINNDRGPASSEGYMGLGIAGRTDGSFTYFDPTRFPNQQVLVWLIVDPSPDPACNYGVSHSKPLPDNTWQMISLPATPPPGAASVEAIFADDIPGSYGVSWQVFAYNEETGAYEDPEINGTLVPGRGYWIIQISGLTVNLDMPTGSIPTPTTASDACSALWGCLNHPLVAKREVQWNMLGNPFYTKPAIDSLRISTSVGQCADTDGCSIAEAADPDAANVEHDQFWSYNGTAYEVIGSGNGDAMQAWTGYWNPVLPGANGANPQLHVPRN